MCAYGIGMNSLKGGASSRAHGGLRDDQGCEWFAGPDSGAAGRN